MNNIPAARKALESELSVLSERAKKVVAALDALNALEATPQSKSPKSPAKKPLKSLKSPKGLKAPAKKSAAPSELPDTGGDWFYDLLTETPQLRSAIQAAALKKAGGPKLSADAKNKLIGRVAFALGTMEKRGRITVTDTEEGKVFSKK